MKRLAVAFGLLVALVGLVRAEFGYQESPAIYRIYYADSVSNHIRTAVVSFNPLNDNMTITAVETLYSAASPWGLAVCGDDLYWIEAGSVVYRGTKSANTAKVVVVNGLGGQAHDLLVRGGALYISSTLANGGFGLSKTDLAGTLVQHLRVPGAVPLGLERVGMNVVVRDSLSRFYSFSFNAGATTLLSVATVGGSDLAVVDTNLVWGQVAGGEVRFYKRSLGGGGVSNLLCSYPGTEARYMDSVDNRVFYGFIMGGNSYLGEIGVRGMVNGHGQQRGVQLSTGSGLRGLVVEKLNQVKNDFDGDGIADRSVYYPATGEWYVFGTATGFYTDQFGYPGCIPVPGDYDGDGITDYGVFNPATGIWQLFRSSLGYYTTVFGSEGMMPSISDYDNDGKSDLCLYNPPDGLWHIQGSKRGYFTDQFGNTFMIPVDTQTRTQP